MDSQTRQHFRDRLHERARELEQRGHSLEAHSLGQSLSDTSGETALYDNHPADVGSETQLRSQDVAFKSDVDHDLRRVRAALSRLDDGSYGICTRCGRTIPTERLEAKPEAELCVVCQARLDQEEPQDPDNRRPVEEEVLAPPFGRTFNDDDSDVNGFDGEDSWQAAARSGTSETPSDVPPLDPEPQTYPNVFVDAGERRGAVQDVEWVAGEETAYEKIDAGLPVDEADLVDGATLETADADGRPILAEGDAPGSEVVDERGDPVHRVGGATGTGAKRRRS